MHGENRLPELQLLREAVAHFHLSSSQLRKDFLITRSYRRGRVGIFNGFEVTPA